MSNYDLNDLATAGKFDAIMQTKIEAQINKLRPKPRYAIVKQINNDEKYAMVTYIGEDTLVKLPFGLDGPNETGQYVRIEGVPGDRYISSVLGTAAVKATADQAIEDAANAAAVADDAKGSIDNLGTNLDDLTFNLTSNRPMWWSGDPTLDSSFSWERLATAIGGTLDYTTVTSSLARLAGIRFFFGGQRQNVQFLAARDGTVSSFYFDIYKKTNTDGTDATTSWTLVYSSDNMSAELTTTFASFVKILPSALQLNSGDVCLIQFRSSGTVRLAATQMPSVQFPTQPLMIGAFRNPADGVGAAPATFTKSYMDTCYTAITPWVGMGFKGTIEPKAWYDNFSSLKWTNWILRSTNSDYLGIESPGVVIYGGSTDGWQYAQYANPVTTDTWFCQAQFLNPKFIESRLAAGIDSNGNYGVVLGIRDTTFRLYDRNGNTVISISGSFSNGNYGVSYSALTNTYTIYANGVAQGTWTDTSNIQPHGVGYRFAGLAINWGFFNGGSKIDNFYWYDWVI